jgi:hypothetical protein
MNPLSTITQAADLVAEVCRPGLPEDVLENLRAALRHLARAEGYLGCGVGQITPLPADSPCPPAARPIFVTHLQCPYAPETAAPATPDQPFSKHEP